MTFFDGSDPILFEKKSFWANYNDVSRGHPNGGLIRELPQNPLNSGLGIILICPDRFISFLQTDGVCVVLVSSKESCYNQRNRL